MVWAGLAVPLRREHWHVCGTALCTGDLDSWALGGMAVPWETAFLFCCHRDQMIHLWPFHFLKNAILGQGGHSYFVSYK